MAMEGVKRWWGAFNGDDKTLRDDWKALNGNRVALKSDKMTLKGGKHVLKGDEKHVKCDSLLESIIAALNDNSESW